MIEDDPLLLWRLAPELSVVDAAILIAGADPSQFVGLRGTSNEYVRTGAFDVNGIEAPPGFDAAFSALKAAIRNGTLKAQIAHTRAIGDPLAVSSGSVVVTTYDPSDLAFSGTDGSLPDGHRLTIHREKHWGLSMVDVGDLKAWLRSRGVRSGFFFAGSDAAPDDFLNPAHERFSPELALAVSAWMGLADQPPFRRSVKAEIEAWIAANPDAWRGSEPPSDKAKERIATVVNWKREGGAPKTPS